MGWWFIGSGALLLLLGLVAKTREYRQKSNKAIPKDMLPDQGYKQSDLKETDLREAQQKKERLAEINQDLDRIINEIENKEQQLRQRVAARNRSESQKRQKKQPFKQVLNQTTSGLEEKDLTPCHQQIIKLSRQGLGPQKIAEQLDIGVRETRLVLRMHGNEADNDG